jgi:hypothetical protein
VINGHRPAPEIDVAEDAADALRGWHRQVREVLVVLDAPKRSEAIRGLAAWYERVCLDGDYTEAPPREGLDIVVDELALAAQPYDILRALARAHWAIRVAEELSNWRQCLRSSGPGSSPLGLATNRLELALDEARRQLDCQPGT